MKKFAIIGVFWIYALGMLPFFAAQTHAISAVTLSGSKAWAVLLCKYQDRDIPESRDIRWWQDIMGDYSPGMNHYWSEVSGGNIDISGTRVFGWYSLPRSEADYAHASSPYNYDTTKVLMDCMKEADAEVYFPDYYGIMVVVNGDGIGTVGGLGAGPGGSLRRDDYGAAFDYVDKPYALNWVPYMATHGLIVHEMGHGFSFEHTGRFDASAGSLWEMTGAYGDDQTDIGPIAIHPTAYNKHRVGWIPQDSIYLAEPGSSQTVFLEASSLPLPHTGYRMVKIPFPDSTTEYYTLEARRGFGYDQLRLPGEAVLIHHVDTNRNPQVLAEVVDLDANDDISDAGAQWTPGEVFRDPGHGIYISIDSETASGYMVSINYSSPASPYVGTELAKQLPGEIALNGTVNTVGYDGFYRFAYWQADNIGGINYTGTKPINSRNGGKFELDHQRVSDTVPLSELSVNSLYTYRLEAWYVDENGIQHTTHGLERDFYTVWPAEMSYPLDGATLPGATAAFHWTDVQADYYRVVIKSEAGKVLADSGNLDGSITSWSATGLPTDGSVVELTLLTNDRVHDRKLAKKYRYVTAQQPAVMLKPANNSSLGSTTVTFTWNKANAKAYGITIDTLTERIYSNTELDSSTHSLSIENLPADGSILFVNLLTFTTNEVWLSNTYTYTAYSKPVLPARMLAPSNQSPLDGAMVSFSWSDAKAHGYRILIKSAEGAVLQDSGELADEQQGWTTHKALPTDGSVIYVTLLTHDGGNNRWLSEEYRYTTYTSQPASEYESTCLAGKQAMQAGLCTACHGVIASDGTLIGGALVTSGAMGDGSGKTYAGWKTTLDRMVYMLGETQLAGATIEQVATYLSSSVKGACR